MASQTPASDTDQSTKTPQVSIGMPVYNGEPFIREALDSLLAQTFTDFELIISDNASTDGTEVICREYELKDDRIRYVRQAENRGPTANFQFVLDEAVGEYFMWAAADDRRHPDFVDLAVKVLLECPDVGLVFSGMETKNLQTAEFTFSLTGFSTSKKRFLRVLFRLAQPCPSLIYGLYRRDVLTQLELKQYDYFDVYLALWFELNSTIRVIPLRLYVAGTDGVRIPYGLNGKYLDASQYIEEMRGLFKEHLGFFYALILSQISKYLIAKSTKHLNRLITAKKG